MFEIDEHFFFHLTIVFLKYVFKTSGLWDVIVIDLSQSDQI